ncbi:phage holin family protein [Dysgonomonas sp. Marseille-P4677]|nr:phage holin family protein [Dysgonomonas sp. Marseille-P4677]
MIEINFQQIFIVCILLFGEYILVFCMVIADLISGCKKAKQRGELRSSYGFRRTVDKLGRYYLPLFALTIVDVMQMLAVWYLNTFHDTHIPLFPIMTLLGAIGIGIIEIKSILEKAEDKVKFERVGQLAGSIYRNKEDFSAMLEAFTKYLKEKEDS